MSTDALKPGSGLLPDDPERRTWLLVTAGAGTAGAAATAVPFLQSFSPSERAKAAGASVEVDIADIPPGSARIVEWRGKPVWILRRTPEMLASLERVEPRLVDPGSAEPQQPDYAGNQTRSIRPEFLVAVGICTHLGCSPNHVPANDPNPSMPAGWEGGFFCPCHGSFFDYAGRVYKNVPAPTNLEVPPHHYVSDTRVRIGDDEA